MPFSIKLDSPDNKNLTLSGTAHTAAGEVVFNIDPLHPVQLGTVEALIEFGAEVMPAPAVKEIYIPGEAKNR